MTNKIKLKIKEYTKGNTLFLFFIAGALFNAALLRLLTVGDILFIKPIMGDLIVLIILGAFSYFIKSENKMKYFVFIIVLTTAICISNAIYYGFYTSYASVSLIKTSQQIKGVKDAVEGQVYTLRNFIYLWFPIAYLLVYKYFLKNKYFKKNIQISKNKTQATNTFIIAGVILFVFVTSLTGVEIGRFYKQWNREYVVLKFGVYIYQFNDIVKSLEPRISGFFGYDEAMKRFREFYAEKEETKENEYTNIFEGKNIITIHAESIQTFTMELKFNGEEVTPNLNEIANNGLFFSNFYTQVSVGTSSDTEFTLNTSLMPAANGTVFVTYWDKEYVTIPKILKEKGYYSFSMHGNVADFWNRRVMHEQMGYDRFYSKKDYEIDEIVGLGISDKSFFRQSIEKIQTEIANGNTPFYTTSIMLSNHTPFTGAAEFVDYDVDIKIEKVNELGVTELVSMPYIEDTKLGNYIKSVHYADAAIGDYLRGLDEAGILEDTIVVIYGDHDARLAKKDYERLYNYSTETGEILDKEDENYKPVDFYTYELNRKVPFIIYSKEENIKREISTVMGTYDILPTLGNMFGFKSPYQLGHDIFGINQNVVVFANGNYLTDRVYYNNQKEEYLILDEEPLDEEYISVYAEYADEILKVSNNIIMHDLIKKDRESQELLETYIR